MTIRFGIVGYGDGAAACASAIRSSGSEVVAVVGLDPASHSTQQEWGCSSFAGVREMLAGTRLDAAWVCASLPTQRKLVEQLLAAGVHVLCDKPLSVRSEDARAIVALAEEKHLVLAFSSKFRHAPDLQLARHHIDEGAIGRPISCEVTLCGRVPLAGRGGSGVVMVNGSDAYDILTVVLGEAPIVSSVLFGARTLNSELEDTAEIHFHTSSKVMGRIALSRTYDAKDLDYLVVHGTEGTLRVGWSGGALRAHGAREWTPFGSGYDNAAALARQVAALLSSFSRSRHTQTHDAIIGALEFVERVYEVERFGRGLLSGESWTSYSSLVPQPG